MHIVLCSHNAELEGAPLFIVRLAKMLQAIGNTTNILFPTFGPLAEIASLQDTPNTVIPHLYSESADAHRSVRRIMQSNPDVVIINTILGAHLVQHVKKLHPHVHVLWCIHESECDQLMHMRTSITPEVFAIADAIIFASKKTQEVYEQFNTGNMHVIHYGLDIASIQDYLSTVDRNALRMQYQLPTSAIVITLIGTICPRKGQREFIEAGMKVLEHLPKQHDVHFVIAGKCNPAYEQYIENILSEATYQGMRDQFHLLPEQKNPFGYFACSDIYVCNSFIESFPIVIMEAMAFGLPIAASNTYGVAEQITDKENGLLHLSGNTQQLHSNLLQLIQDDALRAQLGSAALQKVQKEFSQEIMIQKYISLLELLHSKSITAAL